MTFYARLAAASLILTAMGASACSQEPPAKAPATPREAVAASPDVYAFRIGAFEALALKDGEIVLPVGEGAEDQLPWPDMAAVAEALEAADEPAHVHLSIQPLLLRSGDRVVLIDTGAGGRII